MTLLLVISSNAWSAKLYVLENLRLRTEPSLESAILATIKKGKEVEVLGIDGDFTHIESPSGTKGWVASSFLTTEKPIEPEPTPKPTSNKPAKLTQAMKTIKKQKQELKSLKKKLSAQEKILKKLQLDSQNSQEKMQHENMIKSKVASASEGKLAQIRAILGPDPEQSETKKQQPMEFSALSGIHYSIAAGLLLLGFIIGLLWGDFIQRRRHGGYRV